MVETTRDTFREYVNSFPRKDGEPPPEPRPLKSERRRRLERAVRDALPRPVYEAAIGYGANGVRTLVRRNPGRGRMLPDFLLIGAAKGGTTSLFRWLSDHPQLIPPSPLWARGVPMKEVHFFDYNFYRRTDWYRGHFPLVRERREFEQAQGLPLVTGEASASYLSHRWAPERARRLLPEAKIMVVFRNPVDRAYSQFHMSRREGYENLSFEDAVDEETTRLAPELARVERDPRYNSLKLGAWSYLQRSRYDEHVARWLEHFPREQFLFLEAETMFRDPYATLDTVSDFLGLSHFQPPELPRLKDGGGYEPLSSETRARLAEYFRPHNERLQELTGKHFSWAA